MAWGFARNRSRRNVAPQSEYIWSETFGLVYDRTGRWTASTVTRLFPSIARCLNRWLVSRLSQLAHHSFADPVKDWRWTAITVNRGYLAERHVDGNNHGPSIIRSLADSSDRLLYWPGESRKDMVSLPADEAVELPIASHRRLYAFDGTCPHENKAYQGDISSRMSIIFFLSARGWNADPKTTERIAQLGFVPASDSEDAERFRAKFDILTGGSGHTSWTV